MKRGRPKMLNGANKVIRVAGKSVAVNVPDGLSFDKLREHLLAEGVNGNLPAAVRRELMLRGVNESSIATAGLIMLAEAVGAL